MAIVKVTFDDWNGNKRTIDVTSDICAGVNTASEEKAFVCAIRYIRRRYTECYHIQSVEMIAR